MLRIADAPDLVVPVTSDRETAFARDLASFRDTYAALWRATPAETPVARPPVDRRRKRRAERATDRFVDEMEQELRSFPEDPAEQTVCQERLKDKLRDYGRAGLELPAAHREIIFSDAWFDATEEFARRARAFDEGLEIHDLFQALRNVWIMNLCQLLLDRPIALTPAMVGYSLLYPYTDNLLDDPSLAPRAKEAFCRRLERRLEGELPPARDERERAVFDLVGKIEADYERGSFPGVYLSLLAIHRAQERSLGQQSVSAARLLDDDEILQLSVAKGGASVLADGYLVAGELDRDEADFCFGYGVMLQLIDDLQDVRRDLEAGHATLFTRRAGRQHLDRLASRLHRFLGEVLDRSARFSHPRYEVLKDVIRSHCGQLIVQAAGQSPRFFSRRFRRRIETASLVRFSYARKKRRELPKRFAGLGRRLYERV